MRLETLGQAVARVRGLPAGAPDVQRQATVFGILLDCSLPRPSRGSGGWPAVSWGAMDLHISTCTVCVHVVDVSFVPAALNRHVLIHTASIQMILPDL
jgi:hypothetical protein